MTGGGVRARYCVGTTIAARVWAGSSAVLAREVSVQRAFGKDAGEGIVTDADDLWTTKSCLKMVCSVFQHPSEK